MDGLPSHHRTQLCPCVSSIAELILHAAHRQSVYGKNMSDSSKKGNYSVSCLGTGSVESSASNRYARRLNVILPTKSVDRYALPKLAHNMEPQITGGMADVCTRGYPHSQWIWVVGKSC